MDCAKGAAGPSKWAVYPAIDLRRGRVVRLRQGDPDRETVYSCDAAGTARRWAAAGAEWLHVVNLDGALGERGEKNLKALERMLADQGGPRVQFGGGLRDPCDVRRVVDLGVSRVVFGTAAVRDPALVKSTLESFGAQRVAVAIDAHQGNVRTHGWRECGDIEALDLARRWAEQGIRWLIYTDVARDGMEQGLNLQAAQEVAEGTGLCVIASGGVAGLEDVRRAYAAGLAGVIVGRALYEGDLGVEEAVAMGRCRRRSSAAVGAPGKEGGQSGWNGGCNE